MLPNAILGSLMGSATGDALGLPYEGLSHQRAHSLLGPPNQYRLLVGRGMVSDDAEHAWLTAEAIARSGGDVRAFEHELAHLLRQWLLTLPAGIGFATLRATFRLVVGIAPHRSGVFSAGNGPAMRAAVIGASLPKPEQLGPWIRAATRLTHTDPKAEYAALAVALAAWCQAHQQVGAYFQHLEQLLPSDPAALELLMLLAQAEANAQTGGTTPNFATQLGLSKGVTGYAYHTVPVALHPWFKHSTLMPALQEVILCGGDTDTTASITGGVIGANGVVSPAKWQSELLEWTFTENKLLMLSQRVEKALNLGVSSRDFIWFVPQRWPRNIFFTGVVLTHGLRRLFPPYH